MINLIPEANRDIFIEFTIDGVEGSTFPFLAKYYESTPIDFYEDIDTGEPVTIGSGTRAFVDFGKVLTYYKNERPNVWEKIKKSLLE